MYNVGYIYCYEFNNGKKYIGQTINLKRRKAEHQYDSLNGSILPFHKALKKYNNEYQFYIIEKIVANKNLKTILNEIENFHIHYFDTMIDKNGYNLKTEGIQSYVSKQTKVKTSQSLKCYYEKNYYKHIEKFTKSSVLLQKYHYDNSKKYYCFNNKQIYSGKTDIAKKLNIPITHLSEVCKGNRKNINGFYFCYLEDKDTYSIKLNNAITLQDALIVINLKKNNHSLASTYKSVKHILSHTTTYRIYNGLYNEIIDKLI